MNRLIVISAVLAVLMLGQQVPAEVPQMINYQGILTDSEGQLLSGAYYMTFTIYDAPAPPEVVLWQESQTVEVSDGLFRALLGSVTPLADTVFNDTARYLGIRIGTVPTEPEISPRTRLASAPYAYRIQTIDDATGGDIYGDVALHSDLIVGDGEEAGYIYLTNASIYTVHIAGSDVGGGDDGAILMLDNSLGDNTILLDADDDGMGCGKIDLFTETGSNTIRLLAGRGDNTGGELSVCDNNGSETVHFNGNLGFFGGATFELRDSDSTATVSFQGASGSDEGGAQAYLREHDGTTTISMDAEDANGGGIVTLFNDNGITTVHIDAKGTGTVEGGAQISLLDDNGTTTISMDAENGVMDGGAAVAMYTGANPSVNTIYLDADDVGDGGGIITMHDKDGTKTVHIDASGTGAAEGGAQLSLSDSTGTTTISLDAQQGVDGGAYVYLATEAGDGTIRLDADYGGTGEGRVITSVLEITGGSDLSEQFDIRRSEENTVASPGMVVCIDPHHPGELVVSSRAYDPTVAGIISGAGGVKPGMLMSQDGSISDGQYPVALTGRVYCRADASYGSIRPGDLLTTSETPGYAMKVSDHRRAHGAVIGKAMTALEEGQGLILILVSLD